MHRLVPANSTSGSLFAYYAILGFCFAVVQVLIKVSCPKSKFNVAKR